MSLAPFRADSSVTRIALEALGVISQIAKFFVEYPAKLVLYALGPNTFAFPLWSERLYIFRTKVVRAMYGAL